MKTITVLLTLSLFFATLVSAQESGAYKFGDSSYGTQPDKGVIEWIKTDHDFGDIKQGIPVSIEYEFKNVSLKAVVVQDVKASCGCTTPEWPKQPIQPGKTGKIKATYNAEKTGVFSKEITVTMNDTEGTHHLYLKGSVLQGVTPVPDGTPKTTPGSGTK